MTLSKYILITIHILVLQAYLFPQNINPIRITNWNAPGSSVPFSFPKSVNLTSFGADTSGKSSSDMALRNAIKSLNGPGEIFIPKGTFLFKQTIELPDSIILQGELDTLTGNILALFKISPGNNNHGIRIQGIESTTSYPIPYPLIQGQQKLVVNQPNLFTPGDFIRLVPMDDSLLVNNSWAYNTTGQIFQVLQIIEDSLILNKPLRRSYSGTNLPIIYKIIPRQQVHINCIKLERLDSTSSQSSTIFIRNAADCSIKGIESYYGNFAHIDIQNSIRISVENSFFTEAFSYGSGGKGYGIMLQSTTGDCFIHQNNFQHLRHSMILQSGANGNVLAYNYSIEPFWTETVLPSNSSGDLVLHGNYAYMNLFEGNVVQNIVIDNSHGINGPYNTFFRNRSELYGIFMNTLPATDSQNFIGNQITNTSSFILGLYSLQGTNHFEFGNMIKGNATPKGSTEPAIATMFAYDFGSFYNTLSTVPPIKNTNWQNQNPLIEANYRFKQTSKKAICYEKLYFATNNSDPKNIIENEFDVFPNPFSNEIIIKNNSNHMGCFFKIYDTLGRLVYSGQLNQDKQIIATITWNCGIYFLFIEGKKGCIVKQMKL